MSNTMITTVEDFAEAVKLILPLLDRGKTVQQVARFLMIPYGDVSTKHSGLVSKSLVSYHEPTNTYYRKGKYTGEHFITRTNTCRQICEAYVAGTLTDELLYTLLDEGRSVHYTTEDDNIRLRPYQKDLENYPTWEEQYKAAGIELVEDPGMFGNKRFYYEINGVVYRDINEAAAAIGVIPKTIKTRCFKGKEGYKEYSYNIEE